MPNHRIAQAIRCHLPPFAFRLPPILSEYRLSSAPRSQPCPRPPEPPPNDSSIQRHRCTPCATTATAETHPTPSPPSPSDDDRAASTTCSIQPRLPVFGVRCLQYRRGRRGYPRSRRNHRFHPGIARGRGCSPARTAHATGCATGSAPCRRYHRWHPNPLARTAAPPAPPWPVDHIIATIPADREADGRSRTTAWNLQVPAPTLPLPPSPSPPLPCRVCRRATGCTATTIATGRIGRFAALPPAPPRLN